MPKEETGIDGNCPTWPHASAVYSHAYRWMREHGADVDLIDALAIGNENDIKARILDLNTLYVLNRED